MHSPIGCKLQKRKGDKTDTLKKHHNRLLRDIPDTPERDNYGASDSAKTCSITKQKNGDPICMVAICHVSTTEGKIYLA